HPQRRLERDRRLAHAVEDTRSVGFGASSRPTVGAISGTAETKPTTGLPGSSHPQTIVHEDDVAVVELLVPVRLQVLELGRGRRVLQIREVEVDLRSLAHGLVHPRV